MGAPLQNGLIIDRATEAISLLTLIPIGGVIGPLAEELMFRQFLIGLIGRRAPTWAAVVGTPRKTSARRRAAG